MRSNRCETFAEIQQPRIASSLAVVTHPHEAADYANSVRINQNCSASGVEAQRRGCCVRPDAGQRKQPRRTHWHPTAKPSNFLGKSPKIDRAPPETEAGEQVIELLRL